jgi:adenosylmethionine-8-amino-7-oxononanoate aminotransferase
MEAIGRRTSFSTTATSNFLHGPKSSTLQTPTTTDCSPLHAPCSPPSARCPPNPPMTHDDLRRWDREIVWHAFTQMAEYEPLIIERAHGCTLVDIDGREYVDGVSSLWCNVHGHRHRRLDAALREQLEKVAHVTSLGMSNPTTIRLAKRLVDISPAGLSHVFFSDDGATAVEVALKMAFQYWRQRSDPRPAKTKYIAYDGAYHGDTLGSVSVGGVAQFHEMFRPLLFDVVRLPAPDSYRLPAGVTAESATSHYLGQLEAALKEHHQHVAAVVIEPLVQAAAGMIMHPPGYLRGVRELTRKYDVLLIADEVAVGMGRTGKMFACEHEQVAPDFLCLAKGLTGGYLPLAATLTTTEVWQAFLGPYADSKSFFHGHTFGGNPLGAAVALATLDVFDEEQTLANLSAKTQRLADHLARIAQHPHVGDARQRGLMAGIELVRNRDTQEPFPWTERRGQRVCDHALTENVWLRPLGNVVVILPPLTISLDDLDRICHAVQRGIERATVDRLQD